MMEMLCQLTACSQWAMSVQAQEQDLIIRAWQEGIGVRQ